MKRLSYVASLGLACALAGCGGSTGTAALPASAGSTPQATNAHLLITIPQRSSTQAGSRAPAYVSPATQSIAVQVDSGTVTTQNLTPTSPNCSVGGPLSALTCTVPIIATAGSHTFTFTTYDGLGGTGNVLSTNAVMQSIVANQANSINVTLAGVPTSLQVTPFNGGSAISGNSLSGYQLAGALSNSFLAIALDADNNYIIGPGAPTLAVSITGASAGSGIAVSPANSSNPNEFTVSAQSIGTGTLAVTATPVVASAGSPLSANVPLTFDTLTTTIVGDPNISGLVDGTGTTARFRGAAGIAYDTATGDLYVTDTTNCAFRAVSTGNGTANSGTVTTLAGGTCGLTDGIGAAARFANPIGDAYDPANGYIYVTDLSNCAIRQVAPGSGVSGSGTVVTVAGGAGCGFTDGTGTAAKFLYPAGAAYDPVNGDIYVTDDGNCAIRQITPGNGSAGSASVITLAGSTTCGFADGTGTSAQFKNPASIAYDPVNGYLYVTDNSNCTIRQVTTGNGTANSGVVTTLAGSTTCGAADGTGTSAKFGEPSGIAYDSTNGDFYITDYTNCDIRQMTPGNGTANSATVTTVAGTSGVCGFSDGAGSAAMFYRPDFLAYDPTNSAIYITDSSNQVVRELQL